MDSNPWGHKELSMTVAGQAGGDNRTEATEKLG